MDKRFDEYINTLSPELQEKAKKCRNMQELNEFVADNDLELPEEVLDTVSGGMLCDSEKCPKCGSTDVSFSVEKGKSKCNRCGYEW